MALTITLVPDSRFEFGNFTGQIVKCVPAPSDYVTHGYLFGGAQVGLRTLALAWPNVSPVTSTPITSAPYLAWDAINQKLQAFEGGSPAGTIAASSTAPTITTVTNSSTSAPIYVTGGALTQTAGASGVTGVQAPTITATFTGGAAALLAECAASTDLSGYEFLVFCLGTP